MVMLMHMDARLGEVAEDVTAIREFLEDGDEEEEEEDRPEP
jgi:hypothetical protein